MGPYTLDTLIATGAQSQVWLAIGEEGEVALKVPRSRRDIPHLQQEATLLRQLAHPKLVSVLNSDPEGAWLAIEHLPGQPIHQWAKNQPLDQLLDKISDLIEIVEHLHQQQVIHGDLTPNNVIILPDGRLKLIDLGVATIPKQQTAHFRGTLGYSAPELLDGAPPTIQTDLYGVGAVLYTCLVQRPPFSAPDPAALTYLPLVSLPPPPSLYRSDLPAAFERALMTLLSRRPERRPRSLSALPNVLSTALQSPIMPPVVGMRNEREQIRRAVVGASDGECRVIVLYGPPGSGRSTLCAEAQEFAKREGLRVIHTTELREIVNELNKESGIPMVVFDATVPKTLGIVKQLNKKNVSGLFIIQSTRPQPQLGSAVKQLTPAPFSAEDCKRIAHYYELNPSLLEAWRSVSGGLPTGVLGHVHAHLRGSKPIKLSSLPRVPAAIYQALSQIKRSSVQELAQSMRLREDVLLDHLECLIAQGLIHEHDDGNTLAIDTEP